MIVLSYECFTSCVSFPKGIGKTVGHAGKGGPEHTWALPEELGQVSLPVSVVEIAVTQ